MLLSTKFEGVEEGAVVDVNYFDTRSDRKKTLRLTVTKKFSETSFKGRYGDRIYRVNKNRVVVKSTKTYSSDTTIGTPRALTVVS